MTTSDDDDMRDDDMRDGDMRDGDTDGGDTDAGDLNGVGTEDVDFERLLDWVEGRLDTVAAEHVRHAVADADPSNGSSKAVDWIRSFHEQRRAIAYPEPPAVLRARLHSLFDGRRRDEADRFLAELVSDSRAEDAVTGVRGAASTAAEQLVYLSVRADVVLDVTSTGPRLFSIRGQVLPNVGSAAGYEIRAGSDDPVTTDRNGVFTLTDVPDSLRVIHVRADDLTLDVPVDLRERP